MATKTRRQREAGLKDARQGLTILALLAAIWAWQGTSSLFVGCLVFILAVFAIEIVLILPEIVRRHRLFQFRSDILPVFLGPTHFHGLLCLWLKTTPRLVRS